MSAIAEGAAAPRRRAAPRKRAGLRGLHRSGVVWIVAVAALLAGVVAISAFSSARVRRSSSSSTFSLSAITLIATTRAQLSTASANERIVDDAVTKLGLVQHDPNETTTVRLDGP